MNCVRSDHMYIIVINTRPPASLRLSDSYNNYDIILQLEHIPKANPNHKLIYFYTNHQSSYLQMQ